MKQRCTDPALENYPNYGARGITYCARWGSFEAFLEDMGRRPGPGYSLDRKDTNGNYEPDNCRWATAKEQANNRRNARLITFNGETLPVSEWNKRIGGSDQLVQMRIRYGWSEADAVSIPATSNDNRKGIGAKNNTIKARLSKTTL